MGADCVDRLQIVQTFTKTCPAHQWRAQHRIDSGRRFFDHAQEPPKGSSSLWQKVPRAPLRGGWLCIVTFDFEASDLGS